MDAFEQAYKYMAIDLETATAYAAIAQAEQLKRMADAAERRNELLEEYNIATNESAKQHTAQIATSVSKFVGAIYGDSDSE